MIASKGLIMSCELLCFTFQAWGKAQVSLQLEFFLKMDEHESKIILIIYIKSWRFKHSSVFYFMFTVFAVIKNDFEQLRGFRKQF